MILGEYDFSGHYSINMDVNNGPVLETYLHEIMHMIYTHTSYGLLLRYHNKISIIDNSYLFINNFLLDHCVYTKEAACVFCELVFLIKCTSFSSTEKKILNMKKFNKDYYNYVKILLPFLYYTDENPNNKYTLKIPIDEMLSAINHMVLQALNVRVDELDVNYFRLKRELKKLISKEDTAKKYFPNSRFKILIKCLLNQIDEQKDQQYSDEKMKYIVNTAKFNAYRTITFFDDSYMDDINTVNGVIEKIKQFLLKIYSDSKYLSSIKDCFDKIKVQEMDHYDMLGLSLPINNNPIYPCKRADGSSDLLAHMNDKAGVLFMLGNLQIYAGTSLQNLFIPPSLYDAINSNLCGVSFLSFSDKINYLAVIDFDDLFDLCVKATQPIVVNYKACDNLMSIFDSLNKEVYIYCDRAYTNAREYINSNTNDQMCMELIGYSEDKYGLILLVVEIKENRFFLLPITGAGCLSLYNDIVSDNTNLNIDNKLNIDKNLMYNFDLIICSIFYY